MLTVFRQQETTIFLFYFDVHYLWMDSSNCLPRCTHYVIESHIWNISISTHYASHRCCRCCDRAQRYSVCVCVCETSVGHACSSFWSWRFVLGCDLSAFVEFVSGRWRSSPSFRYVSTYFCMCFFSDDWRHFFLRVKILSRCWSSYQCWKSCTFHLTFWKRSLWWSFLIQLSRRVMMNSKNHQVLCKDRKVIYSTISWMECITLTSIRHA